MKMIIVFQDAEENEVQEATIDAYCIPRVGEKIVLDVKHGDRLEELGKVRNIEWNFSEIDSPFVVLFCNVIRPNNEDETND